MATLTDWVNYLKAKKYVIFSGGIYLFTEKFHNDLAKENPPNITVPNSKNKTQTEIFKQFVIDARIRHVHISVGGNTYSLGTTSSQAKAEFIKLMKLGVGYDNLVRAAHAYYSTVGCPVTLYRFLKEGIWEAFENVAAKKNSTGERRML